MTSMFFEGDLQSGISLALRESKSVACFVRDDGEESSTWENEYLEDAQVKAALEDRAVTLRLQAGSPEAAFLSAYYPVQSVPTFTIIHNGSLVLDLKSGQDKAAFKAGVLTTLIATSSTSSVSTAVPSTEVPSSSTTTLPGNTPLNNEQDTGSTFEQNPRSPFSEGRPNSTSAIEQGTAPLIHAAAAEALPSNSTMPSSNQQSVVQRLLEERRRKLEVDKKEKEKAERADRKAKAEARQEAISAAPSSARAKQASYAQEQRKRNSEAKLERERILRQIEQDKLDRKEREERRKALAKAEIQTEITADSVSSSQQDCQDAVLVEKSRSDAETARTRECAIQVRLFDGSTVRRRFPNEQTLADIREWVDAERSDDIPFTFKQILSPSPNRSLTISEEQESLAQLGFVPSATLVTVPIKAYTAAYSDASPSIILKVASIPYNTIATGAGLISGALGTFLGLGQVAPQQGETSSPTTADPSHSEPRSNIAEPNINIRTLHDQRRDRGDHQLYNGNHINVEPRNDDSDKEK